MNELGNECASARGEACSRIYMLSYFPEYKDPIESDRSAIMKPNNLSRIKCRCDSVKVTVLVSFHRCVNRDVI